MARDEPKATTASFVRDNRAWIVVIGLFVGLAAFVHSSAQTKLYQASADVQAVDPSYGLTRNAGEPKHHSDVNNALYLISSQAVQDPALRSIAPNDAKVRSVAGTSSDQSDLLTITAVAESADVARDAANAVADEYVSQQENLNVQLKKIDANQLRQNADQLQDQIDAGGGDTNRLIAQQADYRTRANELDAEAGLKTGVIRVVAPAQTPADPFAPHPWRDALVAGLAGLLLGLVLMIIIAWIRFWTAPLGDDPGPAGGLVPPAQ